MTSLHRFHITLFLLLLGVFFSDGQVLTREKILKERQDKINVVETMLRKAQNRLSQHHAGEVTGDDKDQRLQSLHQRIVLLKSNLFDLSKPLSDEEIEKMIRESAEQEDL